MLRSIFSKTLFEKRWGIFWWSVAILATTLLVVVLFPTFQNAFGESLKDVPDSLKQVLGEAADYQRIEGFLELQVYMQMIFFTVIYGIILCTGLIAGDEGQGTLQTLLAQPVSRTKVYFHKLAASAVMVGLVSLALFAGVAVGALIIGEPISLSRNLQAAFAVWLVSMTYSLIAFALGAVTGSRGAAGALAGVFAFATYLISSLVQTADVLKYPNYFSPFKYFNNPRILDNGLQLGNVSVLVIASLVLIAIGWLVFRRRDIYSR